MILLLVTTVLNATNYTVSDKTNLQNKMNIAMPGDTVFVASGSYNWGLINVVNTNGTSTSAWIVLKPLVANGVNFTNTTYIKFSGKRISINGFKFTSGNAGTNAIIQTRDNSGVFASYSRVTNITFDNYNPAYDSIGNNWVALYGTNNRLDHCTFYNKTNANPVVSIVYDNNTIPQKSTSTYHLIDSNFFNHIAYQGDNGGEVIRLGTSSNIATDGFNIVEYNLFQNCIQQEPEIISNKSCRNTFRYNTIRDCNGGITIRRGRYCSVYSNFIFRDQLKCTLQR